MEEMYFDCSKNSASLVVDEFKNAKPENGVLKQYKLKFPEFSNIAYFAPFQFNGGAEPPDNRWPDGTNRIHCLVAENFETVDTKGLFLLVQLTDGQVLSVLPICDGDIMSWLSCVDDDVILNVGTFGCRAVNSRSPVCSWAIADSGWAAAKMAWDVCFDDEKLSENIACRVDKNYPEMYRYLGWCSWEEFKTEIDQQKLVNLIGELEQSNLPVRYMLIDDGYLSEKDNQIIEPKPGTEEFPGGWQALLNSRQTDKIKWMGLWLNFNGYWNGVRKENNFEISEHLEAMKFQKIWTDNEECEGLVPGKEMDDSLAFYRKLVGYAKESGFDFVKVDNQARNVSLYENAEYPVKRAFQNAEALETVCDELGLGLINCMAHNTIRTFSTKYSAVTRCSEDYLMGDALNAKQHLHNSYCNMLWFGHTVWGDHDMFHSCDPASGKMMAVSKAMSGAPVYLSDPPADFVEEFIMPLCMDDGELLRPLAPAIPLEDSMFINPFKDGKAFRVAAPLPHRTAAVVVYNLSHPETNVKGVVKFEDLAEAYRIQENGYLGTLDEGIIVCDCYEKKAIKLMAGECHEFNMTEFSDKLFILSPIKNGLAIIGDPEKYLSPCAVESVNEAGAKMKNNVQCLVWQDGVLFKK